MKTHKRISPQAPFFWCGAPVYGPNGSLHWHEVTCAKCLQQRWRDE